MPPQAGGFVEFVQRGQCQRVVPRDDLDADGLVSREIVGGPSIGVVELAAGVIPVRRRRSPGRPKLRQTWDRAASHSVPCKSLAEGRPSVRYVRGTRRDGGDRPGAAAARIGYRRGGRSSGPDRSRIAASGATPRPRGLGTDRARVGSPSGHGGPSACVSGRPAWVPET